MNKQQIWWYDGIGWRKYEDVGNKNRCTNKDCYTLKTAIRMARHVKNLGGSPVIIRYFYRKNVRYSLEFTLSKNE